VKIAGHPHAPGQLSLLGAEIENNKWRTLVLRRPG
jgi:hypothetical protein